MGKRLGKKNSSEFSIVYYLFITIFMIITNIMHVFWEWGCM